MTPKFCKQYAQVGVAINAGLSAFVDDVTCGTFPDATFSPYALKRAELDAFASQLRERGLSDAAADAEGAAHQAGL